MTLQRIRWLAIGAALLVLLAGYLALQRKVTILADGRVYTLSTRAITVGGALRAAGLGLEHDDIVEPPAYAFLRDDMVVALHRAVQVQLYADGRLYSALTVERNPQALLAELAVEMNAADRLLLAGEPVAWDRELPYHPVLVLELRRAVSLTLIDGEESKQFLSSALTLGEALAEEGISLYVADRLSPPAATPLTQAITARLTRSEPLEILLGERSILIRSAASTVGEALAEAGIALQDLDRSEPGEEEPIPNARRIRIIRVQEKVQLETEPIPFSIEWQPDPEIEIDNRSVIQLGQNGLLATSQRLRYEDGEEVSNREEAQWVLAEPLTQISGYGTKIVVRTAVVDGGSIEYWRALDLFATSYSPCRSGTSTCYYYTSLGDEVKKGIVGVYLDWWRKMGGHTVYVPGYGPAKISDVGAYPDGRPWIDLGYSDEDWVTWAQWVTVYFTTPIPPANEILYILP